MADPVAMMSLQYVNDIYVNFFCWNIGGDETEAALILNNPVP